MRVAVRIGGVIAVLLLVVASPAGAQAGGAEAEITGLINQWAAARVNGDTAFLERFYAAELRIGQMNGGLVDRRDDIAMFAARRIKPEYIRNTDVRVSVFGDTAIVSDVEPEGHLRRPPR